MSDSIPSLIARAEEWLEEYGDPDDYEDGQVPGWLNSGCLIVRDLLAVLQEQERKQRKYADNIFPLLRVFESPVSSSIPNVSEVIEKIRALEARLREQEKTITRLLHHFEELGALYPHDETLYALVKALTTPRPVLPQPPTT